MRRSHITQAQSTASYCRLTSDCSRMHSKVSSDLLPSDIKGTRPVRETFKMAGYFLDSPHTSSIPQRKHKNSKVKTVRYNLKVQLFFLFILSVIQELYRKQLIEKEILCSVCIPNITFWFRRFCS
jgi:hypothetical protein